MFDSQDIILEVQSQPCIWNSANKSYRDRSTRKVAWEQIAEDMNYDWSSFTADKKNEIITELQKKWKHLRDYYIRENNKSNLNGTARKKRNTPYFTMLNFLDVTLKNRNIDCNLSLPENGSDISTGSRTPPPTASPPPPTATPSPPTASPPPHASTLELIASERKKIISFDDRSDISTNSRTSISTSSSSSQAPTLELFVSKRKKIINKSLSNKMARVEKPEDDHDEIFLMSLLPDMKTMKEREKIEFKIEIMCAMKRIKYSNTTQRSSSPYSSD